MEKPDYSVATVADVRSIESHGPWDTKSGGKLNVLFELGNDVIQADFFNYQTSELSKIPTDVRGLRLYQVSDLAEDSVGAKEWHRVRNELVFVLKGSVKWICEDVYGGKKEYVIDGHSGVWTPPFILHTYETVDDNTQILVVANTLFLPGDPRTHDSYSTKEFRELQALYNSDPK